jgi:hypothetical protein
MGVGYMYEWRAQAKRTARVGVTRVRADADEDQLGRELRQKRRQKWLG